MSDEKQLSTTFEVSRKVVTRDSIDKLYYVMERVKMPGGIFWQKVSRGYPHSTSCYANLGRLVAHESKTRKKKYL